ncbi:ARF GAP-like zinc finger-containing protein [Trichomonas vaginalis G3]|uniref:ARF GAP-like zinc finger-containing protein n=1 Tax=Trichomonas vaginalis (strain ATCC PRA-98 / G3) TaxID=412133 RepID=A2FXZ9_TRIV3|nr:GTPase activator protein [Trichomonas vaginalis G3]EAX90222.1 ARF GAP-like zinc finger-containing protein [Trichomonas vaginalis G3]KAI5553944.1 GTPase activator protein [Trichomonas vaginalis G3]|eukprot:XP_001303152.1 ARF GAP-like zinc finger-containing protein [Trichomonas vaginalis G3]
MSSDPKKRVALAAQRPENQRCADCGCKLLTSSIWASSTLGIFICINCSGRHRNLGTHITFVRSVNLDSWTDEQATVMESIGNEISNQYWEANLPADYPRPATEDLEGLTKFIRLKYELGKWADKSREPPNVLLKKGKSVKKARIIQSGSAQPVSANSNPQPQQVQRSQSTNTFNFNQPAQQSMTTSNSVDMLFGPPEPAPVAQPFGQPQQQRQMNSSPGFNPFMQGFPAAQPQPTPVAQQNPFVFGKPMAPNAFAPQPQQPQQNQTGNARAELQSMLSQSMGTYAPPTSTNVFRQGNPQQPQSAARNMFNSPPQGSFSSNQPMRGPGQNRSKDAFSGISPF